MNQVIATVSCKTNFSLSGYISSTSLSKKLVTFLGVKTLAVHQNMTPHFDE